MPYPRTSTGFCRCLGTAALASLLGCGDGVGRPIQQGASGFNTAAGAGAPASAPAGGGAVSRPSVTAVSGGGWAGSSATTSAPDCTSLETWDPAWTKAEEDLLLAINFARAAEYDCLTARPSLEVPAPLTLVPALRCAARIHSGSGHLSDSPASRVSATGFVAARLAEVTATTDPASTAPGLVALAWMLDENPLHCMTLMDPQFTSAGIGFAYVGDLGYWTVDLAAQATDLAN